MKSERVPFVFLVTLCLAVIIQVYGTDIGYHCQSKLDCQTGNGGRYSKCDGYSSVCVCTHDYLGLRRWNTNKDWNGRIQEPFVSDFIPDTNTSICYDPDRAVNSRPEGMVIKTSDIPGAGLGVFTEKYISRGTVYGPYQGIKVYDNTYNRDMSWRIETSSEILRVDAKDKSLSNWLRYVNMPNNAESENLLVLQHAGEIYYLAFKSILPGSELLVWYGDAYAERLGIKEHERPKYTYGKDGYAGGECLKNMLAIECLSNNALCIQNICLCKNGSHARGDDCITDETVGGKCFGKNGDMCLKDENAVCLNGLCICKDDSSQLNRKCVHDETYGGVCLDWNQDCHLDKNAECVVGICQCKFGTSEVSGKCVADEHLGGLCKGVEGSPCTGDTTTVCSKGVCICNVGSTAMAGKCMKDGLLRGFCKAGKCEGKNVVCNIKTQMCVCKTRYLETGGKCVN